MYLRQFEYLVALDRERHFGRAAAACHVGRPTLSQAVRRLEAELGVPLVRRSRTFEGFTPEGERVLVWAQRAVSEMQGLTQEDFRRILVEPEASLLKQYKALMGTEKVALEFADDAIDELARLAAEINSSLENIGARRLHTVLEKLLDKISYEAPDRGGESLRVDAAYVDAHLGELVRDEDLSRYIL